MKKRKIFIVMGLALLLCIGITVSASFIFQRKVSGSADWGNVQLNTLGYVKHNNYVIVEDTEFDNNKCYYSKRIKTIYNDKNELVESIYYVKANVTKENFTDSKKSGIYVLEDVQSDSLISLNNGEKFECFVTSKKGTADELDLPYLNQVELKFDFKSSIDTYLRIEFDDAWKSTKTYLTTNKQDHTYIEKDKIEGVSPFAYGINVEDNDWIYDEQSNCAYYKYIIPATCGNINDVNANLSSMYSFRINPNYFYMDSKSNISYSEMVSVELSYNVSIVQANRAEKKWHVKFGVENTTLAGMAFSYKPINTNQSNE